MVPIMETPTDQTVKVGITAYYHTLCEGNKGMDLKSNESKQLWLFYTEKVKENSTSKKKIHISFTDASLVTKNTCHFKISLITPDIDIYIFRNHLPLQNTAIDDSKFVISKSKTLCCLESRHFP